MWKLLQKTCLIIALAGFSVTLADAGPSALPAPHQTDVLKDPNALYNMMQSNWIPPALHSLNTDAVFNQPFDPDSFILPRPGHTNLPPKVLTLREAILLSLRFNPDIKSDELQRVVDKFQVVVARNKFEPQFSFKLTGGYAKGQTPQYELTSGVSVTTPYGTTVSLGESSQLNGQPSASTLTIQQPLLRGLGTVNYLSYKDALISEETNKLGFKGNIMSAVVQVVQSYRSLVGAYNQLAINLRTLKEQEVVVKQFQLRLKAGKVSRSDMFQQETTLETTRLSYVQQQNQVNLDYQAFLSAIGLIPSANVRIQQQIDLDQYHIPSLRQCIKLALKHNVDYQSALISLQVKKDDLTLAKNKRLWKLDLTATKNLTKGATGVGAASNADASVGFDLEIPIDDIDTQSGVIDARIALEQAKIALSQKKQDLIKQVYNQWVQIHNERQQVDIAAKQVALQQQTLKDFTLKQRYGRATVFELTQTQDQLLTNQTNYVSSQISYLNDVSTFYQLLGITLDKWNIKLRY